MRNFANELNAMAKMIFLHIKLKDLKTKLEFYPALTIDNVNEFTFDELNDICQIESEISTIKTENK